MIALSESIGRFVALANLEKNIVSQASIEQAITDLIDLITIRIQEQSVDQVADSLLENVFNLRFELIEWLAKKNKDLNFYIQSFNQHLAVNLQLAPYSILANTISSVLLSYEHIIAPRFESIYNSFEDITSVVQNDKPTYSMFKMLALHPSPQIQSVKNWIDSSLQLEIGLLVSDLILTNQLPLSNKRIEEELVEFLNRIIIRFGAYSIFTGFWVPNIDDTSNLTNSMKILSATLELNHKSFYKTSKDGLFNLINN
jgi:hypothetical protein